MAMVILAIDLGKANSLFCWYQVQDQSHRLKTVPSTPWAFEQALEEEKVDRVVIEVCDMAGWVVDLCRRRGIEVEVANANGEGWRWRNVTNKCDKTDVLKLARMWALGETNHVPISHRPTRHWRIRILYRPTPVERCTAIKDSIHALLGSAGRALRGGEAWTLASLSKLH